jgi:hypothetical protein
MAKVYYHATGPKTFEWVDSPEKATQESYKEVAEVTQKQFKGAELVEIPAKTQQQQPKWVISTEA